MTPGEIRSHAEQRKLLSGAYKQLFDEVVAILFRYDPIGIDFEENTDEYDAEAGTIIAGLTADMTADGAASVVHEEFVRWFSREDAGPRGKYSSVAVEILAAYNHYGLC